MVFLPMFIKDGHRGDRMEDARRACGGQIMLPRMKRLRNHLSLAVSLPVSKEDGVRPMPRLLVVNDGRQGRIAARQDYPDKPAGRRSGRGFIHRIAYEPAWADRYPQRSQPFFIALVLEPSEGSLPESVFSRSRYSLVLRMNRSAQSSLWPSEGKAATSRCPTNESCPKRHG